MFRKTFIRLILVMMIATTSLLVFAATRTNNDTENESCEAGKECIEKKPATEFMILETIGRTMMSISGS